MTALPNMPPARHIPLSGGGWLNVHEQAGEGPPLLLLHGFTDCAQSYRLLLPHLAGRHIVIPDLRGHGASFCAPIRDLDDFCLDIEAMADMMALPAPILVGHSMGSLIAVSLAARGKIKPQAIVTLSGSLQPASAALKRVAQDIAALPHPLPLDHPFFTEWHACHRPVPDAFLAPLREACAAMRQQDWTACLHLLHTVDLRDAARTITIDSLIVSGTDDPLFPESHQATLCAALPASRRIPLDGVGHNPHWEVPIEVANLLMKVMPHPATG